MNTTVTDLSPLQAAAMLDWLAAMGADEIIAETACNRFESPVAVAEKPKQVVLERGPVSAPAATLAAAAVGTEDVKAAANCLTVGELAAAFAAHDGCALKKSAMNCCFIGGTMDARILVMGDKPRTSEDKEGQVFAGKNAALLEAMLKAIGLDYNSDVMLANFVPWRPPGNRAVTEPEVRACMPFAFRLIELVRPQAILMLGGLGAQWLGNGDQSIAKQRGKWMEIGGVPALATFHPDDLMRTPNLKRLAWTDLKEFRAKIDQVQSA